MTLSDLAAIRALVEAVDRSEIECLATIHAACLHDLVPAAREAVEQAEAQLAQLARAVAYWHKRAETAEALAGWQGRRIEKAVKMINEESDPDTAKPWLVAHVLAALEGRDE